MLRALFSGVAGLKTHQTKMDVIGNNIANVNTYAFKSSRVSFKDVFYQTLTGSTDASENLGGGNASQIGYGSMVGSIDVLHTRSGFAPTGSATDLFIDGEGYFIVRDGLGNEKFTRAGMFEFDGAGNLVDKNGHYVCGYPIKRNADGSIVFQDINPVDGKATVDGAEVSFGKENGDFFNGYQIKIAHDTTGPQSAVADINSKTITVTLVPPANTRNDLQAALKAMTSNPAGGLDGVDLTKITVTNADTTPVADATTGGITGGVDAVSGIPAIDTTGGVQPIKKPGKLIDTDGDGIYDSEGEGVMEYKNISIGADGIITGTDSSGKVMPIGQICLANIPNPGALVLEGNSYLKAVNNTGDISFYAAGSGVTGSIVAGGLEMSNVDLSNEFADMIITQRGFQANSRIITVGDEMLQELVNLKR